MSTLEEVEVALSVIAFGLAGEGEPSREAFSAAFSSVEGQDALRSLVTMLHCTSEYPASLDSVNLRAMDTLYQTFELRVGYSDHTSGVIASLAAVARGARVIEKHITLNKSLPGPDQAASLDPKELQDLVRDVRAVERTLGSARKEPQFSEVENMAVARKSLIAKNIIEEGSLFSEHNIGAKRSGTGRSPMEYWELIGSFSTKNYKKDELI